MHNGKGGDGVIFLDSLDRFSEHVLREKVQRSLERIRTMDIPNFLELFRDHTEDLVNHLYVFLKRAEAAKSQILRENYLYQVDELLNYYSTQYHLFRLAKVQEEGETWNALHTLVRYLSDKLKFNVSPIPLLSDSYYSTGSFSYYKEFSLRLKKEYYFVAVDILDSPLLWPLIAHELAHCWLNQSEYLREIYASPEVIETKAKSKIPLEKRIEETLCDLVATRLFGPSYLQSYTLKLWLHFPVSIPEDYPQHSFRLECMFDTLVRLDLTEATENLKRLRERFCVSWQKEEISPLKEQILEISENFPTIVTRKMYEESLLSKEKLYISPPKNPVLLFLVCWNKIFEQSPLYLTKMLRELSSIILKALT